MISAIKVRAFIQIVLPLLLLLSSGCAFAETGEPADASSKKDLVLVEDVRVYGRKMGKAEALKLEQALEKDPQDLTSRARLLGYYFYNGKRDEGSAATRTARRRHIVWLIKNHPDSIIGSLPEATIDPSGHYMADKVGYETASSLWRALAQRDDAAPQTLLNAYNFLRLNDKPAAEKIAKLTKIPYLLGDIYALGVSRVTMTNQNGFVLMVGTSHEDERYAAHAVEALRTTEDKKVLDSAASVLMFSGAIAQAMFQRKGETIEPMPLAFAGELLERCGDCRSQGNYYKLMVGISKTPAERQKYAQAELALLEKQAASQPPVQTENDSVARLFALSKLTDAAFFAGEYDKAEDYANKTLRAVSEQQQPDRYGTEVHTGHIVLGRIALLRGDVKTANRHLLAAADVKGGPTLQSFGPNMALAKELLERGQRKVVIAYLKRCKKFWDRGQTRLDAWIKTIEKGGMPDFDGNLLD